MKRFTGTPVLAIEVLSSQPAPDLVVKARKYADAGLPHYWVVDPDPVTIRQLRLASGEYRKVGRHSGGEAVTIRAGPVEVTLVPQALAG